MRRFDWNCVNRLVLSLGVAGFSVAVSAQSLEENYARLCTTPGTDKVTCDALRKAMLAKLQAQESGTGSSTGSQSTPKTPLPKPSDSDSVTERRAQWGVLVDMIGRQWITSVAGKSLYDARMIAQGQSYATYSWAVPGQEIVVHEHKNGTATVRRRIRRDPTTGSLIEFDTAVPTLETVLRVQPDGSLTYTIPQIPAASGSYRLLADGSIEAKYQQVEPTGVLRQDFIYVDLTPNAREARNAQVAMQAQAEAEAKARAEARRAQAEEARANSRQAVLNGLMQGIGEAAADHQRSQATHDAVMANVQQQMMATQERQRQRQRQAQDAARQQERRTASMPRAEPAADPIEGGSKAPPRQVGSPQSQEVWKPAPQPASDAACKIETKSFKNRSLPMDTQAQAERFIARNSCPNGLPAKTGASRCTTDDEPVIRPDANGVPRVVGRRQQFVCEVTYTCEVKTCRSDAAGASAQ